MRKQLEKQTSIFSQDEKNTIIKVFAERAQSILDNNGSVTVKLFNDSLEFESEGCISICGEGSELEINFQESEIRIPSYQYIDGKDLDSYNPILYFTHVVVEFDMNEEDC